MMKDASEKSSLVWLNLNLIEAKRPHHLWPDYGCNSSLRQAASIRAKIISGSYILQSNRARFNQFKVDASCPLCGFGCEDVPHFLIECPSLESARGNYIHLIKEIITKREDMLPIEEPAEWTYKIFALSALGVT